MAFCFMSDRNFLMSVYCSEGRLTFFSFPVVNMGSSMILGHFLRFSKSKTIKECEKLTQIEKYYKNSIFYHHPSISEYIICKSVLKTENQIQPTDSSLVYLQTSFSLYTKLEQLLQQTMGKAFVFSTVVKLPKK